MGSNSKWEGYQDDFLDGFVVPIPKFGKWKNDLAINQETNGIELPFINYSSYQSISRRLPIVTVSNIYREKWIGAARKGSFKLDDRLTSSEQLSTRIYQSINLKQKESERKMAKGHMVKREDVQWHIEKEIDKAVEAAQSTFYYTNACPQHQAVNNTIWKHLENSILIKGRSRRPLKAIVFTGPVLGTRDPWLVFHDIDVELRCPLRFWKIVYYVNDALELRCAAFLMSHKEEVEEDGYVQVRKLMEILESKEKPFLEFDEREKYQVNISLIEKITGLKFKKAKESLQEGGHAKLSLPTSHKLMTERAKTFKEFINHPLVEGLVLD